MFPSQGDEPGVSRRNIPSVPVFGTWDIVRDDQRLPRKLVAGLSIVYQAEADPATAIVLLDLQSSAVW
jgi:hypothetical protein